MNKQALRKQLIGKIDYLEENGHSMTNLLRGQLELLDVTKAPASSYKDLLDDVKSIG